MENGQIAKLITQQGVQRDALIGQLRPIGSVSVRFTFPDREFS